MSATMVSALPPTVETLLTGPFVGIILSTLLVGIVGAQAWTFFNREDNGVVMNATVIILCLIVIVSDGLDIATTFNLTIANWGNPESFLQLPRFLMAEMIVSGVTILIVDVFYASRIYKVNRIFACIAAALIAISATAFACGCAAAHFALELGTAESLGVAKVKSLIDAQNFLRLGANLLGFGVITWYLQMNLASTMNSLSSQMFHRVLKFVVTRGILVIAFQVVGAAVFATQPGFLRWTVYQMMLDKIYVITMMAMLNSRSNYRGIMPLSGGNPDLLSRQSISSAVPVSESGQNTEPNPFIIGGPVSRPTRPTSLGERAQALLPFRVSDAVPGPSNTVETPIPSSSSSSGDPPPSTEATVSPSESTSRDSISRGPPPEVNRATRLDRKLTVRSTAQSDIYPPSYRSASDD